MGMQRTNTSHAYSELVRAGFLFCKEEGWWYLNPLFCWKGRDEKYESAVARLISPQSRLVNLTSSAVKEKGRTRMIGLKRMPAPLNWLLLVI